MTPRLKTVLRLFGLLAGTLAGFVVGVAVPLATFVGLEAIGIKWGEKTGVVVIAIVGAFAAGIFGAKIGTEYAAYLSG